MNSNFFLNFLLKLKKISLANFCILALVFVSLLGAWLRINNLTTTPTWWDEHVSVFSATGMLVKQGDRLGGRTATFDGGPRSAKFLPNKQIVESGNLVDQIRIYNVPAATLFWDRGNGLAFALVLNVWTRLFGFSDLALRTLPCLLGILAIPCAYAVGLALFSSRWIGLFSALLVSCNALLIRYSQEVRPYSLAVLLSLLATWIFVHAWNVSERRRGLFSVLYTLAITLLWFSHYLAVPVLTVAHFLSLSTRKDRKWPFFVWLQGNLVACSALIIWMLWGANLGLVAMGEHDKVWLHRALEGGIPWLSPFSWGNTLECFVNNTLHSIVPYLFFWSMESRFQALFFAAVLTLFFVGLILLLKKGGRQTISGLVLSGVLGLGGLLAIALSWRSGHNLPFMERYQTFYICYELIVLSAAFTTLVSSNRVFLLLGSTFMLFGFLCLVQANCKVIFSDRGKIGFSLDAFLAQADQQDLSMQTIVCSTLDWALIAGLKVASISPHTGIFVSESAEDDISFVPTLSVSPSD